MDSIPPHIKHMIQDKRLSYQQKMTAFMLFMPKLPSSGNEAVYQDNLEIGRKIKRLVDQNKIQMTIDKDFVLKVNVLTSK